MTGCIRSSATAEKKIHAEQETRRGAPSASAVHDDAAEDEAVSKKKVTRRKK
jgi:hypothetical protein